MNYFEKIQDLVEEKDVEKLFDQVINLYEKIQKEESYENEENDKKIYDFMKKNIDEIDLFEVYREYLEIYLRRYRGVSKKAYVYYSNYIEELTNHDEIKTALICDSYDFLEIIPELLIKFKKIKFTLLSQNSDLQKITLLMQNKYKNIEIKELEKYDLVISNVHGLAYKISSSQTDYEFEKYISEKRKNISKEIIWNYQKSKKYINILTEPTILKDEYNFTTKEFIKENSSIQKIIDYSYWNANNNVKEKMFFEMTTDPSEQNQVYVGNSARRTVAIEYDTLLNNYHLSKYDNIRPIENYEEYLKEFDNVKKLKEIADLKISSRRIFFSARGDIEIKVIHPLGIKDKNGKFEYESHKDEKADKKTYDKLNFVKKGDILIPTFGRLHRIVKINEDHENLACSHSHVIIRIKDQKTINPDYVYSFLQTDMMTKKIKTLSYNRLMPTINPEELNEIKIPIVSLEKQEKFTKEFLENIIENRKTQQKLDRLVSNLKGA
jgi:transposase-like protein